MIKIKTTELLFSFSYFYAYLFLSELFTARAAEKEGVEGVVNPAGSTQQMGFWPAMRRSLLCLDRYEKKFQCGCVGERSAPR